MCSKHVEAWNKLIVKQNILCIKLVNYWDKYTEMHCQQNVKKCTIILQIIADIDYKLSDDDTIVSKHVGVW